VRNISAFFSLFKGRPLMVKTILPGPSTSGHGCKLLLKHYIDVNKEEIPHPFFLPWFDCVQTNFNKYKQGKE
jgi:hypothetical protein